MGSFLTHLLRSVDELSLATRDETPIRGVELSREGPEVGGDTHLRGAGLGPWRGMEQAPGLFCGC